MILNLLCYFSPCSGFSELSTSILISDTKTSDCKKQQADPKQHFPDFLILLRDCNNKVEDDSGKEISATEYLNTKILVPTGQTERDRTVQSILTNFPKIECLLMPNPGSGIDNPQKDIDSDFLLQLEKTVHYILSNIRPKLGFNLAAKIDGCMLVSLLEQYIKALNEPNSVPNLEVSYWTIIDSTIQREITDLLEAYSKQMKSLLEPCLPMEEGDLKTLASTHSSKLEESLQGILETESLITIVAKGKTLYEVHENVYCNLLRVLSAQIHKSIPGSDANTRKLNYLKVFERAVIEITDESITDGKLYYYAQSNKEKSRTQCVTCFQNIYEQQKKKNKISLRELETAYYKQAVGPAKNEVFQIKFQEIPGPPSDLTVQDVTGNSITVSWRKADKHPDAATFWNVSCKNTCHPNQLPTAHLVQPSGEEEKFSFSLINRKPKSGYVIKVRGMKSEDKPGEYSQPLPVETKAGKPDMPEKPTITPESHSVGTLQVEMLEESRVNGSPVTHIVVAQCSDKKPEWKYKKFPVDYTQGAHQALTVDIECKENEGNLWFQVKLENAAGPSESSKSAQLVVERMIPSEPQNIIAYPKAKQIELKWDHPKYNPNAVKTYEIQYREVKPTNWIPKSLSKTQTCLQIENLTPKTEYEVYICAKNKNNEGKYVMQNVTTKAGVPNRPQYLELRVISAKQAKLVFCRQTSKEENGSSVHSAIVMYLAKKEGINASSEWTKLKQHKIKKDDSDYVFIPIDLHSFDSVDITSSYRIQTVNSEGSSQPSLPVELHRDKIIPGPPQALTKTVSTCNSLAISWQKPLFHPKAVKKYEVGYRQSCETGWTTLMFDPLDFKTQVSNLKPNKEYEFYIRACNLSLASEKVTLTILTEPSAPPRPKIPVLIPNGTNYLLKIELPAIEESGREVTKFLVHYYSQSTYIPSETKECNVDFDNLIVKNTKRYYQKPIDVNIDQTQWITTTFINAIGKSDESDLVGVTQGDVTPGKPENLQVVPDSRQIKLHWGLPKRNGNAAKHYVILYSKHKHEALVPLKENFTIQQERIEGSITYTATVTGLIPYTYYFFAVQAVNFSIGFQDVKKIREGEKATIEVITTKAPPDKPLPPKVKPVVDRPLRAQYTLTLPTDDQLNGGALTKVIIEFSIDENMWNIWKEIDPQDVFEEDIPNLSNKSIFYYLFRVRMQNDVGLSEPSNTCYLPLSELQPGQPKNLTFSNVTAHSMKINWEMPTEHSPLIQGYVLHYFPNTNRKDLVSLHIDKQNLEYEILELKSNQSYTVQVYALAMKRSQPAEKCRSTLEVYPSRPTSLKPNKIGQDAIKIRWSNPTTNAAEVVFYKVELRSGNCKEALENDTEIEVIKARRTRGNSTVFRGLETFTSYTISVSAYNDNKRTNDATEHIVIKTKMSGHVRRGLQAVAAIPTLGMASVAMGYALSPDKDIVESDEEYHDPATFPSAPQNLTVDGVGSTYISVHWEPPRDNVDELRYYQVQALEFRANSPDFTEEFPCVERNFRISTLRPGTKYVVKICSYNFYRKVDPMGAAAQCEVTTLIG